MKTQLFSQFISALISQENGTFRKMLFKPGGGNHLMRFESETSVFQISQANVDAAYVFYG